ncbi:LPS translocon maturation chaperone LptM [Pseudoxanthomonas putridarboris]|uniref:Lipoprotein n=1 Tax=Pseudoxanthomonas putridarboris TaxID=752605 RepID=A0ABU9IX51_9GAMM
MSRNTRLLTAAALMAVLSACGAKGPLFLPEKPVEEAPIAPAEPATTEETPATDGLPPTPPIDPATVPATDGNG